MANPWGDEPVVNTPDAAPNARTNPSAPVNPWGDEPAAAAPNWADRIRGVASSLGSGIKEAVTGAARTDPAYRDRPEFAQAYADEAGAAGQLPDLSATASSEIAPTEAAQLDIIRKRIPGLEQKRDAKGNLMLKAPGMKDWAYLNAPGLSRRDFDEFGTQTLATAPFLGAAGAGTGILSRMTLGAGGMAGGSVAQDALATAAGSEQGIDPARAAVSGAIGAALPAGEGVIKGGVELLKHGGRRVQSVVNPDAVARKNVVDAIRADRSAPRGTPLNAQEVAGARQAGQDLRVMDLGGETTRGLARSAANQSPEARAAIMNVIDERFAGQGPRTEEFVRNLVAPPGATLSADRSREALEAAARHARDPLYQKARQDGAGGLMSPVLTQLEAAPAVKAAMASAARSIKNRAAVGKSTGVRGPNGFTLEFWDLVKRHLDDRVRGAQRSGAKTAANELTGIVKPLVAELDRLVPSYAPARGTASTFFRARDALDAGEKFVGGKYDLHSARKALAGMTAAERNLFAEGFASRYIQQIRKSGDRRSILNSINASPDARERVNVALGPNRARALEAFLRVEGIMDLARHAMGNSTTARQLVELGLVGYGYSYSDPHAMMIAALSYGDRAVQRRVAERVAKMLLSNDPKMFQQALKQIGSTPMMDALRAFDKALVKSGAGREAAQELTPEPATPSNPPPTPRNVPQPGLTPPVPAPEPTPPTPPSVDVPKQRSAALEEAQRMAEDAIRRGAPRDAVMQRLSAYLQANGTAAA